MSIIIILIGAQHCMRSGKPRLSFRGKMFVEVSLPMKITNFYPTKIIPTIR